MLGGLSEKSHKALYEALGELKLLNQPRRNSKP
jgi:hypothetical protein